MAAIVFLVLLLTASGCGLRSPEESNPTFDGQGRPSQIEETPAEFFQGLAIAEARIDGLGRSARFVIDTGAVTALRRDFASRAAFSADPSTTEPVYRDTMGRALDVESVVLRRLEIGRLTFSDLPALLVDSEVFDRVCPAIDGVLGTGEPSVARGFLDRVAVEIDRDQGLVRLSRDGALLGPYDVTLPLRRYLVDGNGEKVDDSGTWVPVAMEGRMLWAVLDTGGSGLSEMTSDAFTDLLGRSLGEESVREYRGEYGVTAGGAAGGGQSWIAEIREVQLGRYRFESIPFRIVPGREDGLKLIVLHQNLLDQFNIVLDYQQSEMRIGLADSRPATDVLPLQLGWQIRDGKTVIVGMLADGAAQRAGVELGDEVVMINDFPTPSADPQSICRETIRWRASGGSLYLRLRRDHREYEVTLPRSDLRLD